MKQVVMEIRSLLLVLKETSNSTHTKGKKSRVRERDVEKKSCIYMWSSKRRRGRNQSLTCLQLIFS